MSHGHGSAGARHKRRLAFALGLTASYMVIEAVVGFLTNSLVLVADAGHMLTDVIGLSLALTAIWFAQRPASASKSYGYYRVEILAAALNGLLLFGVAGYILFEAVRRFQAPPEVPSIPLLVVASIGLAINLLSASLLLAGAKESLNLKGALFEVVGDILGSVGAIAAGIIILTTGWQYADPLFAAAVGLFILPRTWRLLSEAVNVLLEGTPKDVDIERVRGDMQAVEGVITVHDLHAWTLTSGRSALSAHLIVTAEADQTKVIVAIDTKLREDVHIEHVTLQLETPEMQAQLEACLPGGSACYVPVSGAERPQSAHGNAV